MKLSKYLALFTVFASNIVAANEMEISTQKQALPNNTKQQIYIDDVRISFANNNQHETTEAVMRFKNGQTTVEGNIEIALYKAVAVANNVTYKVSNNGVLAQMDKVTFSFNER